VSNLTPAGAEVLKEIRDAINMRTQQRDDDNWHIRFENIVRECDLCADTRLKSGSAYAMCRHHDKMYASWQSGEEVTLSD
jgi:hypothetical protein